MRDISDRITPSLHPEADVTAGTVRFSGVKFLWFWGMATGWIIGGTLFFSWSALLALLGLCAIILCGGHSIGMHRKLIHDSFDCPKNLERFGVYLGTLVGLGGPFTMMRTHDMRDWAQRQSTCHPYFCHDSSPAKDFWWQVNCRLDLDHAPDFHFPRKLTTDPFMKILQNTAMAQQIPLGIVLFLIGGWGFVFWGICGRVTISIFGHWLIGYFAHNHGPQDWINQGAVAQGYNVKYCGLITFGECWHNNHHAFPESARLGLYKGQHDPGWWVLTALKACGLVSNITLPADIAKRDDLQKFERG